MRSTGKTTDVVASAVAWTENADLACKFFFSIVRDQAMNAEMRFHSIVIGATTAIIFMIWLGLTDLILAYPAFAIVLSGLISLGLYRLLGTLLLALIRSMRLAKRLILGPSYVEGTWAGFFVGKGGRIRLFAECFEQDLSRITIRGRAFKDDRTFHGSWIALDATLDLERAKLTYYYETDAIGNTFINPGIGSFNLDRPQAHKAPVRLIGFSSDLFSPAKLFAIEEKISDKTLVDSDVAFERAKEIYERYKHEVPSPTGPRDNTGGTNDAAPGISQ